MHGKLTDPKNVPLVARRWGRHFAFHPNGRFFYSLNEEASTLASMRYDASSDTLTPVQEISTLPAVFVGTYFTSEVLVARNGWFVYAANRLHDTIAVFAVAGNGELTLLDETWTRGDHPRNFNIEPNGRFMYVCNHRGDSVTTFQLKGNGGKVTFTGKYTPLGVWQSSSSTASNSRAAAAGASERA